MKFVFNHGWTRMNTDAPHPVTRHESPGEGTGPTSCRPGPLTRRLGSGSQSVFIRVHPWLKLPASL